MHIAELLATQYNSTDLWKTKAPCSAINYNSGRAVQYGRGAVGSGSIRALHGQFAAGHASTGLHLPTIPSSSFSSCYSSSFSFLIFFLPVPGHPLPSLPRSPPQLPLSWDVGASLLISISLSLDYPVSDGDALPSALHPSPAKAPPTFVLILLVIIISRYNVLVYLTLIDLGWILFGWPSWQLGRVNSI